jgi:hypothetical protein
VKNLTALIVASLPLVLAGCASQPSAEDKASTASSIRSRLPGRWDWAETSPRCGDSAAELSFTDDGQGLRVRVATGVYIGTTLLGPEAKYTILAESQDVLRMQLDGETRQTAAGTIVVWDVVLLDPDQFCWHRADWKSDVCTKPLLRCPGGSVAAETERTDTAR